MNRLRLIRILSNVLFAVGVAMSALAVYLIISIRLSLPPGVCPMDNQRPLILVALGVLLASLILSFAADRQKKRLERDADKPGAGNTEERVACNNSDRS